MPEKKSKKKPSKKLTDVGRLKTVARKMLKRIGDELGAPKTEIEIKYLAEMHDRIFGAKTSLANTLVVISELMLKLEEVQGTVEDDDVPIPGLTEADLAAVNAFICRMRGKTPVPKAD